MRQVTFGGANSLDNYLARSGGGVDWLLWCDEAAEVMTSYWKTIDAVVMGRKTYEIGQKMGHAGGHPGMETYVFSRTLDSVAGGVTLVREDAAGFVERLKQQDGKGICVMGGGELARSLFEAGLIDRLGLNIHPILLGSGVPLFHPMTRQITLALEECRPFKNGCIYASYRVQY
jgi:dihydrofolate reductase